MRGESRGKMRPMREILLFMIDGPAHLLGALIGQFWAIGALAVSGWLGYCAWRLTGPDGRPRMAKAAAVVVFIYAGLVTFQAEKWTALSMLEHYHGEDD
ncbi:hypothetical protein A9K72_25655 [Mesorhizobium loti]|nr:hypothetical protein A9K72_25655 [Mesorhizobium loti]